jgi:peptidoglycan biosynthesis protein MviN/MurJ (putative lipid II flippase)
VWALPLSALSGSMTSVLQATGHHRSAARAGIVSTLVGSGTSLSLIAMIGLPGAAWGVVVRQAIGVVVLAVPFSKAISPLPRLLPLGRLALAAAATAAVLWLVSAYLERTTAGLIAGNILGLVLYGASLFLLRILPWPLRQMWSAWRQSLRSAS